MTDKDLGKIDSYEEMSEFMDTLEVGVVYEVTAEGFTKEMELKDKHAGVFKNRIDGQRYKVYYEDGKPRFYKYVDDDGGLKKIGTAERIKET